MYVGVILILTWHNSGANRSTYSALLIQRGHTQHIVYGRLQFDAEIGYTYIVKLRVNINNCVRKN